MKMNEEIIQILRAAGREDLIQAYNINQSGYGGIMPNGNIVDRRDFPKAIPVPENKLLGIPPATLLEGEDPDFCVSGAHEY